MTASDCAVDAEGIGKRYANGRQALDAVSFQVSAGSVFGLLGQNGAGKTTLIKILCGLLQPTNGHLRVLGCDALSLPQQVKRQLGVVSQDINLDYPLSVRQNLAFHCRYFSVPEIGSTAHRRLARTARFGRVRRCAYPSIIRRQ